MGSANSHSGFLPREYIKKRRRGSRKPLSKRIFFLVSFLVCIPLFNAFFIEADEKASTSLVTDNNDKLSIKTSSKTLEKLELNSVGVSMDLINLMEFPKLGSKEFLKPPPKLIPASMLINSQINTPDKSVSTKEIQEIYKEELIRLLTDDLSKQIKIQPTQEL